MGNKMRWMHIRRDILVIDLSEWLEVKNSIPIDTSVTPDLYSSVTIVIGCGLDDQCLIPWTEMLLSAVTCSLPIWRTQLLVQ
jgi:hypothetical protein